MNGGSDGAAPRPIALSYLCLQATRQGQASHAHVHEIIAGLRTLGFSVELFEPGLESPAAGVLRRLAAFVQVQRRFLGRAPREIYYVRWHPATWPSVAWARLRRVPVVLEVNGSYEDLFIAWPWTRRLRAAIVPFGRAQLRQAARIIAVTEGTATWVRGEAPGAQVAVVPNGANTDLFHPDARTERPMPCPYVIFFGSLAGWHGIDTLLEANALPQWPREVRLVVAGHGAAAARVEQAHREGRLDYLGRVDYREMPGLIAGSLGGLNPQILPGDRAAVGLSPLKLFETMACGVPVIATDFPGQGDLVRKEGCGIVIPPGDPAALARAVARLRSAPEEAAAMGRRARVAAVARHSWTIRAGETAEVLRQALRQAT